MPVGYDIPPWLRPADAVGPYVQGLHLGAQLTQERQRLAAQASEAATRAALQQQQIEQESMLAQQRMEVARAQQQQEIGLKQQELAQRQQTIQMATEQAARKFAAMQAYQQEIAQPGADPLKAILKYGPAMGQQGSAEAAAIRAQQMAAKRGPGGLPDVPVMRLGTSQDEFAMFPSATGTGYHPVRLGTQAAMSKREMDRLALTLDDKELTAREKAHAASTYADTAKLPEKELRKEDPLTQQGAKDWLQEEKTLKQERAALKQRVRDLAGAGGGGKRGRYDPKTGQIDWNVGKLPPDMTQLGAPAGGGETEEDLVPE